MSDTKVRVFLLDDHEVVRRGVADLLAAEPDLDVVGEASTAAEALARVPALRPDVAVLDVRLPDGDGVTVCRELRSRMPHLQCLMLTSFADDEALFDAILAGAAGFVLKQIRGSDLVGAVRTVASGQSLLDPKATARVLERLRAGNRKEEDPLAELTEQERRVLELIGEGLTNRQIGERMHLAEKTVKNYVSHLLSKLGLERRTQVAVLATQLPCVIRPASTCSRRPSACDCSRSPLWVASSSPRARCRPSDRSTMSSTTTAPS
jgi:two-component system response regulator DevR